MRTVKAEPKSETSEVESTKSRDTIQRQHVLHAGLPQWRHSLQVIDWLQQTFYIGESGSLSKGTVFKEYMKMCDATGWQHVSAAVLGKLVHKAFPDIKSKRRGPRGCAKQHYYKLNFFDPELNRIKQPPSFRRTSRRRNKDTLAHNNSTTKDKKLDRTATATTTTTKTTRTTSTVKTEPVYTPPSLPITPPFTPPYLSQAQHYGYSRYSVTEHCYLLDDPSIRSESSYYFRSANGNAARNSGSQSNDLDSNTDHDLPWQQPSLIYQLNALLDKQGFDARRLSGQWRRYVQATTTVDYETPVYGIGPPASMVTTAMATEEDISNLPSSHPSSPDSAQWAQAANGGRVALTTGPAYAIPFGMDY